MDDILFSEGTQLEIDSLFGVDAEEVVEEVAPPEPIKEEKVYEPVNLKQYVTDDFIDLLVEASRKGEVELVEPKVEVAPEPEPEPTKPRTLMEDYSDVLGVISKNLKTEELVTEDDRLTSLETQLIQVRQLFREATMVSGIGQGGDGQTPGSGVVKAADLDDVNLDGIQPGDELIWDGGQFVPTNPVDPGDEIFATVDYVDEQDALRLLKAGDTMTGDLEFKSLTAENYLKIASMRPDGYNGADLFGLEINLADGNTYLNQLRVRGRSDKEIVRLWIQDEQRIETNAVLNFKPPANLAGNTSFVVVRDTNGANAFSVGANGAVRAGTTAAPFIATDDHHLVTKKFSDERLLDVQNQIDNLEASNLSTTTLNYTYVTGTPGVGQFTTNNAAPGSVTQFNIDTRDTANRVLPDLNSNDVITTRLATGTAPVQTFTVAEGSDPAAVTVVGTSTTASNYTDGETYILTVGHSFDGFATTEYVDTKVAITGDTMTGPLILSGDPGTGLQAATKDYVDTTVNNATPNLDGVILADGSVPMTGTLDTRNVKLGTNASILFSDGNQFIKINNERTLGIYGYRTDSFTNAYTRNIDVKHSLTTLGTTTKCSSNLISTRNTGFSFEVKPDDIDTVGYWHTNGTMILKPQTTSTSVAFAVYPKGLDSTNANVAFYVSGDGNVRLGSSVVIDSDLDVVSKMYVDQNFVASSGGKTLDDYLPLTGGTLTGELTMQGTDSFFMKDSGGNETARIQPSGFIRTYDLFRSQRTDNGPAFQARDGSTLKAEIKCDGTATFQTSVKKDNKELATEEYVDNAVAASTSSGVWIPGPRFNFRNTGTPFNGELAYFTDGGSTGGVGLRLSFTSRDGRWTVDKNSTWDNIRIPFGIYFFDNGVLTPVRLGIVYELNWMSTQQYLYCKIAQHETNGGFSSGVDYYVSLGGLV